MSGINSNQDLYCSTIVLLQIKTLKTLHFKNLQNEKSNRHRRHFF